MKRRNKLLVLSIAALLALSACSGGGSGVDPDAGGDPDSGDSGNTDEDEEYVISVSCPEQITYTLSKTKAKKGETVTFTITGAADGFSVKSVTMNDTELTGSQNVYQFTMPNRSVVISVAVSVSGNVTIQGDFGAVFAKEGDVYVARSVAVAVKGATRALFNVVISSDGTDSYLDSYSIDETKCFADIEYAGSGFAFSIASGSTYDFFYDPSLQSPFYVQRVSVDVLPADASSFQSLFDGRYRSESTCNPTGLSSISYTVRDFEDSDNMVWGTYEWKKYENNTSFGTYTDIMNNDKKYYSYAHADLEKNVLSLVDTYSESQGNNDRFRLDYNNYGAYSAQFDIIKNHRVSEYGYFDDGRFETAEVDALRMVNTTAHYGAVLEQEIMWGYRVGFYTSGESDDPSYYANPVVSEKTENGFTSTINAVLEYNNESSTYVDERHYAYTSTIEASFDVRGALVSMNFSRTYFDEDHWNFESHAPLNNAEGTFKKSITVNNVYGDVQSGSPDFDASKYFIRSFDKLRFYNEQTGKDASDGKSYVSYNDSLYISNPSTGEINPLVAELEYSPSTALDLWQYALTSSSDPDVVSKQANDTYYDATACGIGNATGYYTNHTENSGIKKAVEFNSSSSVLMRNIYFWGTKGHTGDVSNNESDYVDVYAGCVNSFTMACSPSNAPLVYNVEVESGKENLVKIGSHDSTLEIDTTGAAGITDFEYVVITFKSENYDTSWVPSKSQSRTLRIIPSEINPTGTTWRADWYDSEGSKIADYTTVEFTETTVKNKTGTYVGVYTDYVYAEDDKTLKYTDTFTFSYSYSAGQISSRVTGVNVEDPELDTDYTDYVIDFYSTGTDLGVMLYFVKTTWDGGDDTTTDDPYLVSDGQLTYDEGEDGWYISAYMALYQVK